MPPTYALVIVVSPVLLDVVCGEWYVRMYIRMCSVDGVVGVV